MTYVKSQKGKKVWILKYFLYDYVLFEAKQHWDEKRRLQRGAKYKADGLKKKVFIEQSKSKMTVPKKSIFSGALGEGNASYANTSSGIFCPLGHSLWENH